MMFEIYDKETNEAVDLETHSYFKGYGVVISLDGEIYMYRYDTLECCADDKSFGVRLKIK